VLDCLDAAAVRRWCALGLAGLRRHQHEIDDLNVYPVPDGDTGTNLTMTVRSLVEAIEKSGATDRETLAREAAGAKLDEGHGLARTLVHALERFLTGDRDSIAGGECLLG
jgi:dihydroxyacetone kinase-like predicted kinase